MRRSKWNRVTVMALAGIILATTAATVRDSDALAAKKGDKLFLNKYCQGEEDQGSYINSVIPENGFTLQAGKKPYSLFYSPGSSNSVPQGKTLYVGGSIPIGNITSRSLTSSNEKVVKVVNVKKGKLKVLKTGKAVVKFKVKSIFRGSAKTDFSTADFKQRSETGHGGSLVPGKKYQWSAKWKIKVICKKHTYGAWKITKEADCENKGTKVRTCKKCKSKQKKTIKATGHTYDSETHKCIKCGKEDPDYDSDGSEGEQVSKGVN